MIEAYPKWFRPDQIAWRNESYSRNQVRKTDQILNVTATTHKFQQRQVLYWQQEEEFIIRGHTTTLCISEETWHIYLSNFARFIDFDW